MCEKIAQFYHLFVAYALKWHTGNGMVADEIYAAVYAVEQLYKLACMECGFVHALEYDVLECESSLMTEIVLTQQIQNLGNGESLLGRHNLGALLWNWVVKAYCNVIVA